MNVFLKIFFLHNKLMNFENYELWLKEQDDGGSWFFTNVTDYEYKNK